MRVAYVCTDPGVPVWGSKGCSIHVQAVLRELVRRGWSVDLFARRLGGDAHLDGVHVIKLPQPDRHLEVADREQFLLAHDRALRIVMEQAGDYDLVYERHALWTSAAMQFAADANIPSVLEVNAPLVEEQQQHRELVAIDVAKQQVARSVSKASVLLAVSGGVAAFLSSFPRARKRTIVVGNGVDVGRFDDARRTICQRWQSRLDMQGESSITVGFTGTLRPWHGMRMLGEAFREFHARHPRSKLLVIGDGPAKRELEHYLGEQAWQATAVTGQVDPHQVPQLLSKCDLAAVPYPALSDDQPFYFSPLKLFEYMACGLPTVASRIGDLPEVLEGGAAGALVPAGDAAAMANGWQQLVANPHEAISMSEMAVDAVRRKHTWKTALDRILDGAGVGLAGVATRSVG